MNNFRQELVSFLNQYKYLTTQDYEDFIGKHQKDINPTYYNQLLAEKIKILKAHNNIFLNRVLERKKDYFDNMFKDYDPNIKLDKNQLKAIIADDNLLVVAGAGAGKTLTMAAKVKYLVDSGYDESEILVISYTNNACKEIENIIHNVLNCPNVLVTTFHALGFSLIKQSGRDVSKVIEDNGKYIIISDFLKNIAFPNKDYMNSLINAFDSFFFDEDKMMKYRNFDDFHQKSYREKFIKTGFNLSNYNEIQIKNRRNYKKTIKGEYLRSKEEVDIANFLYLNGIDYSYETTYQEIKNNIKTHPDFYIKQLGLENYIEHFGVDQNFDNSMYSPTELKSYLNSLKLKQNYINEEDNSKRFIVTYSKYNNSLTYLKDLENKLINKGYSLNKISDEVVFNTLMKTDTESYFSKFVYDIVIPFISIFKRNNYQINDFNLLYNKANNEIKEQLLVLKQIYIYYQDTLKKRHYIDFDDMINLASIAIPNLNKDETQSNYKYLIIDEYQDISNQRYNLTNLLAKLYNSKIMAVGDDWQTIYSFAGADINLFKEFKKYNNNAKQIPIENTYRNSQELIDIAGKFIQKNKYQIKKELKSTKHLSNPIEIYLYDDSNKVNEDFSNAETVNEIINKITNIHPKHKILILGRYNKDKNILLYSNFFLEYRGKIKSRSNPKANITFLTVHKSKGLGFDDVILINGSDELYGFPSKQEDKPIIKLLKNNTNEHIAYPEERRLFYVAMTRTKNKFYITVPESKKSIFIKEIEDYSNVIVNKKVIKYNHRLSTNYICPKCKNKLEIINYRDNNFYIYKCSNKSCSYKTTSPNSKEELQLCPKCGEFVTYRYTKNGRAIYKCISKTCNYTYFKIVKKNLVKE
jgi:DNA helicase-4